MYTWLIGESPLEGGGVRGVWIAPAAVLTVLLALIGNLATNTVQISPRSS
jgi:hypothetical protein